MIGSRHLDAAYAPHASADRAQAAQVLWALGAPLILFPALVFGLTTLWFTLGGVITPLFAWLVLAGSSAAALILPQWLTPSTPRLLPLASAALILLAFLIASLIRDTSMDGQHYHFEAIYALMKGWNPVHGPPDLAVIGEAVTPWPIHYPRAVWVFAANLMSAGVPFTAAKALNILVLLGAGAIIPAVLLRLGFSRLASCLLTGAAVLNPIILGQLFTSMNDGLLGLSLLIFSASLVAWLIHGNRLAAAIALTVMCLALNLKFSAIPLFAVPCAAACLAVLALKGWKAAFSLGAILLGTALISIVLIGWSPYMRNWLEYGHIFHPVMGAHAIDIMTGTTPALDNTPQDLIARSGPERFLFSLLSETHSGFATEANMRPPFLMGPQEIRASGGVDVRLGGFGPLFSGALLLSMIGAALMLMRARKLNRLGSAFLIAAAVTLVSVLIMPQNWWARYVPQFWFVPAFIAAAAIASRAPTAQIIGGLTGVVMLMNAGLVGASATYLAAKRHAEAGAQISALVATGERYCIDPDMVKSRLYLMERDGLDVHYLPAERLPCDTPAEIEAYGPDRFGGLICPCER